MSEHCEWFTSRSSADRLSSIDRSPSTNLFLRDSCACTCERCITTVLHNSAETLNHMYETHVRSCVSSHGEGIFADEGLVVSGYKYVVRAKHEATECVN